MFLLLALSNVDIIPAKIDKATVVIQYRNVVDISAIATTIKWCIVDASVVVNKRHINNLAFFISKIVYGQNKQIKL